MPFFQWFFRLPAFLIFNTILCCDITFVRAYPFVTMPTSHVVRCTMKGTLFFFFFVTRLVVHIVLQICCVSLIAVPSVTSHLSLLFRPMFFYALKLLFGMAIRGSPSSKNTSGPLSDDLWARPKLFPRVSFSSIQRRIFKSNRTLVKQSCRSFSPRHVSVIWPFLDKPKFFKGHVAFPYIHKLFNSRIPYLLELVVVIYI